VQTLGIPWPSKKFPFLSEIQAERLRTSYNSCLDIHDLIEYGMSAKASETEEKNGFTTLGLDPRLTNALGYNDPTPIQSQAIPAALTGQDLVGLAGTGTGKTAAFSLPCIHRLISDPTPRNGVGFLVLTPTRELAIQVAKAIKTYGKAVGIDVVAVYGGTGYAGQIQAIRNKVDVVVATPGRALDLFRKGKFPLDDVRMVVLDEADEMLDMGFAEDLDAILSETPKERQTLLFSATMPPRIEEIAKKHLRKPLRIQVSREAPPPGEEAKVRHTAYLVHRDHRLLALARVLDFEQPTSAIIFCRTRFEADQLSEMMLERGYLPQALHGGLSQEQRDRVMQRFRSGKANLLIATDIAARGLDISHLSHVINYDVPQQVEAYVHRTGRVGRAGREGVAVTLLMPSQQHLLRQIERIAKAKIPVQQLPNAKALKASRLKQLENKISESLENPEFSDELRGLVANLEKKHPGKDVALAAIKLLQGPPRKEDDIEIPTGGPLRSNDRPDRPERSDRPLRSRPAEDARRAAGSRPTRTGMAKVYFGIGRDGGVLPKDFAHAIEQEAGIPKSDIGHIEMTDRFTLVEVPEDTADYVVDVLNGAKFRGRKVLVRPDRGHRSPLKP
jgi:ATP-dependent RNA helicase DeaD